MLTWPPYVRIITQLLASTGEQQQGTGIGVKLHATAALSSLHVLRKSFLAGQAYLPWPWAAGAQSLPYVALQTLEACLAVWGTWFPFLHSSIRITSCALLLLHTVLYHSHCTVLCCTLQALISRNRTTASGSDPQDPHHSQSLTSLLSAASSMVWGACLQVQVLHITSVQWVHKQGLLISQRGSNQHKTMVVVT